jgi:hypothetical protein
MKKAKIVLSKKKKENTNKIINTQQPTKTKEPVIKNAFDYDKMLDKFLKDISVIIEGKYNTKIIFNIFKNQIKNLNDFVNNNFLDNFVTSIFLYNILKSRQSTIPNKIELSCIVNEVNKGFEKIINLMVPKFCDQLGWPRMISYYDYSKEAIKQAVFGTKEWESLTIRDKINFFFKDIKNHLSKKNTVPENYKEFLNSILSWQQLRNKYVHNDNIYDFVVVDEIIQNNKVSLGEVFYLMKVLKIIIW